MQQPYNPKLQGPFSCTYNLQTSELLKELNCSIALSTYQAGKVLFISPSSAEKIIQLPRTFKKPMGIAVHDSLEKIAVACFNEVTILANAPNLAKFYPKKPNTYDSLFLPRKSYFTGPLDIHDLEYGSNDKLYAVNTLFSCIIELSDEYNFVPHYVPHFISELASEDRCHLNGMAMLNGKPKFATAFNAGNEMQSWRGKPLTQGVVIDIEQDKIIADGLHMPHTPRVYDEKLYLLQSAKGCLTRMDLDGTNSETLFETKGFLRGMDKIGDYLFIAQSKLRRDSKTKEALQVFLENDTACIYIVHLPTCTEVGKIEYHTSLDEIYDLKLFPGKTRPNILSTLTDDHLEGINIPGQSYWLKKK